jgi:hypothetical protein
LVVILIAVGILDVIATPRLAAFDVHNTNGVSDRVIGGMSYGQKQAVAKRGNLCDRLREPQPECR